MHVFKTAGQAASADVLRSALFGAYSGKSLWIRREERLSLPHSAPSGLQVSSA